MTNIESGSGQRKEDPRVNVAIVEAIDFFEPLLDSAIEMASDPERAAKAKDLMETILGAVAARSYLKGLANGLGVELSPTEDPIRILDTSQPKIEQGENDE